jgi:hypothetical protein
VSSFLHIGFTGTQLGMTADQRDTLRRLLRNWSFEVVPAYKFHHGDCIGADAEAVPIARGFGYRIVRHPPVDTRKQAFAYFDETELPEGYLERNQAIVDISDRLIVCPQQFDEIQRSGTWSTYRRMKRKPGYVIYLILPGGSQRTLFSSISSLEAT